ncbi:uncharacterized protein [Diadema antillarum]|uniref:uncharacterized protein n=1 Tax=Diadema antillarum TaxID=105358 RepID=UPI003A846EBA
MAFVRRILFAVFWLCLVFVSHVAAHKLTVYNAAFWRNFGETSPTYDEQIDGEESDSEYFFENDHSDWERLYRQYESPLEDGLADVSSAKQYHMTDDLEATSVAGSNRHHYRGKTPLLPMYVPLPIRPSRGGATDSTSRTTVYQLKTLSSSYLRIGADGTVTSVESRFDLYTYLHFYPCPGPAAFRIRGVRSQRFLAMNTAALLIGRVETANDADCSDWRNVWHERYATILNPQLSEVTLLTYHVVAENGQRWYAGFNKRGRPIAWNRQRQSPSRQTCFQKETRLVG